MSANSHFVMEPKNRTDHFLYWKYFCCCVTFKMTCKRSGYLKIENKIHFKIESEIYLLKPENTSIYIKQHFMLFIYKNKVVYIKVRRLLIHCVVLLKQMSRILLAYDMLLTIPEWELNLLNKLLLKFKVGSLLKFKVSTYFINKLF